MIKGSSRARVLIGLAAVALVATACSSSGASSAPSGAATGAPSSAAPSGAMTYTVGISNPGAVGNGWREAMICSAKAQAVASGNITSVLATTRVTDAAGQLADIRDLIAKKVNILLINPSSPDALNPAIAEAIAAGIAVVAIDAPVTAPGAYNLSNDQEMYAYLGAKALFEQMGKTGDVIYMRGIAGHQADTDRDVGFKKALSEYPNIKVAKETVTKWDQATAVTQINDILSSGLKFDGIWTSGIDNVIVDALKTAKHALVPVIGADNAGFVKQLINEAGLKGAAVTNPAAVGGAGVVLGLQILDKKAPADPNVKVTPDLWDNTTAEGKAALAAANDETLPAIWPLGLTVKDWTTYEKDAVKACKGPGE
jgi:ribose transport system substrate-binding protein